MKYPCQGPKCHEQPTKDRYNKTTKRLKGRNAYHSIDDNNNCFTIFCTTGCQNDWINANLQNIVNQRPTTFIRERKFSDDTYHIGEHGWLRSDRVDNE